MRIWCGRILILSYGKKPLPLIMRLRCGRILASANCALSFDMGRRKRYRLRRTKKAPLARAGNGEADHGARAFADGGTAQTPRRRGAGAEGGIPPRSMCPPVRMDAQDLSRTQRRWRRGGETFPANAPRATAGYIGPHAERTDAKSRAPLSGRPRRQSSDWRAGRTQSGGRFSRGSTVGPMQPADSGTGTAHSATDLRAKDRQLPAGLPISCGH